MSLIKISAPDALPIPIEDIREALRITHTTEDATLTRAFKAAVEFMEGATLQVVGATEYELTLDRWPCVTDRCALDRAPFRELVSVKYLPETGPLATIDAANVYANMTEDSCGEAWFVGGFDRPALASRRGAVKVRFKAGYSRELAEGEPAYLKLPALIEQAALLLTGHWFENREATSDREQREIELGAEDILKQLRVWR